MTYEEKCALINDAKPGDVWVNRKTGKKIEIVGYEGFYSLKCKHESGRVTVKQRHYIAGDCDPIGGTDGR